MRWCCFACIYTVTLSNQKYNFTHTHTTFSIQKVHLTIFQCNIVKLVIIKWQKKNFSPQFRFFFSLFFMFIFLLFVWFSFCCLVAMLLILSIYTYGRSSNSNGRKILVSCSKLKSKFTLWCRMKSFDYKYEQINMYVCVGMYKNVYCTCRMRLPIWKKAIFDARRARLSISVKGTINIQLNYVINVAIKWRSISFSIYCDNRYLYSQRTLNEEGKKKKTEQKFLILTRCFKIFDKMTFWN